VGTRVSLAQGVARVVLGLVVAALALVTSAVSALVSRMCWRPEPVTVPYGFVLAVAASMALVHLANAVSRGYGLIAAAAWILGLGFVVNGTSGGSFVIAGDALGWAFLVVGTVGTLVAALWSGGRS
jgi:hypothetical protein